MNDLTTKTETGGAVTTAERSPWEQVRRLAQRESAVFVTFKKGDFMRGEDDVTGMEFRAAPLEIYYGFQRWENSTPGDAQMVRIDQLHLHPRREDLGDNDRSRWETGEDGEPKNPWVRTVRLGLIDLATGELAFFTSSSHGGRDAVNRFCSAYEKDRLRFPDQVPIVRLDDAPYKHKKYGKVSKPEFTIVRWVTHDGSAPKPVDARKQIADDLDDAIPDFSL